jgi:hypothetical protein
LPLCSPQVLVSGAPMPPFRLGPWRHEWGCALKYGVVSREKYTCSVCAELENGVALMCSVLTTKVSFHPVQTTWSSWARAVVSFFCVFSI